MYIFGFYELAVGIDRPSGLSSLSGRGSHDERFPPRGPLLILPGLDFSDDLRGARLGDLNEGAVLANLLQ